MNLSRSLLIAAVTGGVIAAPTAAFATHRYSDVPDDSIYAAALDRLAASGVVKGCTTTTFCPQDDVTRGQLALLLDRQSGKGDVAPSVNAFTVMGMTAEQLRGQTGAQGPAGATGTKGDTGATGATGAQGAAGTKGDTGASGPQGTAGPKGATGADGTKGDTGASGPQGPAGPKGATGADGTNGVDGTNGADGADGADGISPTVTTGNLRNSSGAGDSEGVACGSPSGLSTAVACPDFAAAQPVAGLLPVSGSFSNLTARLDAPATTSTDVFLQTNDSFIFCRVPVGETTCTSGAAVGSASEGSSIFVGADTLDGTAPGSFAFGYTFQQG
jgi:hypothetical protein